MLTEQEKAWVKRRKSPCVHCSNHGKACCGYFLPAGATCAWIDLDVAEPDYRDAAEFEARVALWLVHNGCPNFDPPCAYTKSKPYPHMSWKETDGECPHIPHKRNYCNRWCKLMTARLAVEQEMEKQQ